MRCVTDCQHERLTGINELEVVMRELLVSLAGCRDVQSLGTALSTRITEFGEVDNMEIFAVNRPDKHQALCFLRLRSAAQELKLMTEPGVTRFGDDLLLVVDLLDDSPRSA